MNDLLEKKILIIDCQTTGMHPSTGHLLQLGWCIFDPKAPASPIIEKRTLTLPSDVALSDKIKKMLHLTENELLFRIEPSDAFTQLQDALKQLGQKPIVIAHYAQFERAFLKRFYLEQTQLEQLNFQLLCSQKIAKRIIPNLPSHNLKALAGFYKLSHTTKNEITSHVLMTCHIWHQFIPKLMNLNITSYEELSTWLNAKIKNRPPAFYEYNIERLIRLELPEKPGVYYMLGKDNQILYIGKATSLKTRVNSYFRGIKNRDRRKLEMITQVWDIKTVECSTPLEAALLECDEIKKWDPPYNLLLKNDRHKPIFYNTDYSMYSEQKDSLFYKGPYKPHDSLMNLMQLIKAIKNKAAIPFEEELSSDIIEQGWALFCYQNVLEEHFIQETNWRTFFFVAYKLLKQFERQNGKNSFESWWIEQKKLLIDAEVSLELQFAQKITRWFIRAAETKRKSRQIRRLCNASVRIHATQKELTLVDGELSNAHETSAYSTDAFDLARYDRLSILLSAKNQKIITIF